MEKGATLWPQQVIRMGRDQLRLIRFGLFEVDLRTRELRKNGVQIKLQQQPFQVLVTLLQHAGDVVTREELRRELWPTDTFVDFEHGLNAAIKRLRDALGDSAENSIFVETLARRGYRFNAPVDGRAAPPAAQLRTSLARAMPARRRTYLLGLTGIAIAIGALAAALKSL
jgi:DNA-binding winged helix-turn-helix (wHTH) protein